MHQVLEHVKQSMQHQQAEVNKTQFSKERAGFDWVGLF